MVVAHRGAGRFVRAALLGAVAVAVLVGGMLMARVSSDIQEVEKRAEQIAAAASAQDRAALTGLLKHDAAVDTLLADAQGSEVVHELGQVTDQGDGEYLVTLTRVNDGRELALFLSYHDGEWGPVVAP
ncbi:MAG: hypothetical protein Q4D89_10770 [Arachnia propionica]|uniref:hypothetical protein n=1 Tax=Arachnia propionica TaxID=1750 RepID=UPI002702CC87|nr:hypothetical protein [Arachnia propionica]